MIKNFKQISEKDLNYLVSNDFEIYEKLDMCYFRVEMTSIGAFATKGSIGKCISDIDCITNTINKDICEFVETYINPHCTEFIEKYGSTTIGFFYLPTARYHKITYSRKLVHKFIYSDNPKNISQYDIFNILCLPSDVCLFKPIITNVTSSTTFKIISGDSLYMYTPSLDFFKKYLDEKMSAIDFVNLLLAGKTFSGNYIDSIEGIILRNDKFQYQIKINEIEDNIDKFTKKIYRDTLLKSVVADFIKDDTAWKIASSKISYIDKVSELFLLYMNNTDLFTKFSFDPEDLLPPTTGYIGDIDFDLINDNNVKLICKYNEVNKNIFRIFLYTFTKNISEDKFNFLPESEKEYLNKLIIALNYKNYKEIMLNAYKAKH